MMNFILNKQDNSCDNDSIKKMSFSIENFKLRLFNWSATYKNIYYFTQV